jgi:hypothetical protein
MAAQDVAFSFGDARRGQFTQEFTENCYAS